MESNAVDLNIFEKLMKKMKTETDPSQKALLGTSLSEALLKPNGFIAYYDYLLLISEDSYECIQLFCKVVLTRPSKFSDNSEYLTYSKQNFADFIEVLYNKEDEQSLRAFFSKLFYFLRRGQDLEKFEFFFEPLALKPNELDLRLFDKLCTWDFYPDELYIFYEKMFEQVVSRYLDLDLASNVMKKSIRSASSFIKFETLCALFTKIGSPKVKKVLSLWENDNIPSAFKDAALIASYSDTPSKDIRSSDCFTSDVVQEKSVGTVEENSEPKYISENISLRTISEVEEITKNLKSEIPTDMAYGLHRLRQISASDFDINSDVMEAVTKCLFNEDSFVYLNAIKTCVTLGKHSPSSVCPKLLEILSSSQADERNSVIISRIIQIFDELMMSSEPACPSIWTDKFVLLCSKNFQSKNFELRCAILNYYTDLLSNDSRSFIHNQKHIWEGISLSANQFSESNLEYEATFKLIDTYICVIQNEGRHLADDNVLCIIETFLRKAIFSDASHIQLMARNNLIALERLRQ